MSKLPEGWGTVVGDTEGVFSPQCRGELLNPDMPAQELLLHMGELTESEMLVARAAIRWANSRIQKWMPIEDAPVGVRILVCGGKCQSVCSGELKWFSNANVYIAEKSYSDDEYYVVDDYFTIRPTHFMHLPQPPAK